MAIEKISIREHQTGDIQFQLKSAGSNLDLSTADHIEMQMVDNLGKVYRYASTDSPAYLAISNASTGLCTYTPVDATIFQYIRSPYRFYILVYTDATDYYSVPETDYVQIDVLKEY